ncbi:endonuclease [Flavobacterium piscinae]|uniref:endonuclease n=1 Tax=Flavobacterium piscinae TaxID=2506424 RepID=UPI002AAC1024|nr:endonuclease [Flavobacterium piscinae]
MVLKQEIILIPEFFAGFSGIVFEPIDEFKGDIARIHFYFVTRYENLVSNWSSYAMFDGSSNKVIADPFLDILYSWHVNDPVSQKELTETTMFLNTKEIEIHLLIIRNGFKLFGETHCQLLKAILSLIL